MTSLRQLFLSGIKVRVIDQLSSCLRVFQSGEAAERPDQRGERGRPESRGRGDLAMIHRRPPVPGGAVGGQGGRGGCD